MIVFSVLYFPKTDKAPVDNVVFSTMEEALKFVMSLAKGKWKTSASGDTHICFENKKSMISISKITVDSWEIH